MTKERSEVALEDKWNVEALYPSLDKWQQDFDAVCHDGKHPRWPELTSYQGRLGEKPETLKSALELLLSLDRKLSKLYTYAHLRHDEDITNDAHKSAFKKITSVIHDFHQEASWFEPELLSLSEEKIKSLLNSPVLANYRFYLEKIVRVKPHVLPAEQEKIMALSGQVLQSTHKAFSAINDADFNFGVVKDAQGQEHKLTHSLYGLYIRNQDRTFRKNVFLQFHAKYKHYSNTLCELLSGQVQAHWFNARVRGYPTCLDAALFPKNIETKVYHALIDAVHHNIGALHKYVELRQNLLGLKQIHLYDMNVPLTKEVEISIPYAEATELLIESVAPLGSEYQNILQKGLKSDRWVDRYENKNKRSGAYSSGCFDSMPYILMNYQNQLREAMTLSHEAGHSMHSYLSHKNQPYQYADYPIFLAEVASTFNEELLFQLLLKRAKNDAEKIYLLTQKIDDIRNTFFRQVLFAEFELYIHTMVERQVPLTPKILNEKIRDLYSLYYGVDTVVDVEAEAEWARIPHFYYNFYVYQYATGISAALALAEKVTKGGSAERDAYLSFLKAGSSRYPIEILQRAGVDMRTEHPVKALMGRFSELVEQLAQCTGEKSTKLAV